MRTPCFAILFASLGQAVIGLAVARCDPPAAAPARNVSFLTDVSPILTKLGCNSGGCHGKATGQNGFRLSLLGFEPELDHEWIVSDARGRRLMPASPEQSLLLLKATARLPHGGGRRLEESSEDYQTIRNWIAQGAKPPLSTDRRLTKIELTPRQQLMTAGSTVTLKVMATFSDGSSRDVTRQAVFQSNEPEIASVDDRGLVSTGARPGLVAVMARYGEQIDTFRASIPFAQDATRRAEVDSELEKLLQSDGISSVDRRVIDQWRRLGLTPSPMANDATFLRRATIDICGTLPTEEEVIAYLSDDRPDKRNRLIDRLLERPEYASYFALKWADILQNRGAGYSTSRQRPGTSLFAGWIRDSIAENKPYDRFVSEILTATGNQAIHPPTVWYRAVRKSPEFVESVAQAFLGVRIQCAQCHHHPTENWSQSDYYGLAAVFARVGRKGGFADADVPTDEWIFLKDSGDVHHPRTGRRLPPAPPGAAPFALAPTDDPRAALARWMTSPENPYFARTMANRLWAHFLGRGIVHPIDDARSTNPPSNPELLHELTREFTSSGYDVKHLIRVITGSLPYRLQSASTPGNAGDTQNFARFVPRRLSAETLLDGISQTLDVPTEFPGVAPGTRAIDLPDENVAAHFLDVFGRPARKSACECERSDSPALAQALELINSAEIQRKLTAKSGFAAVLSAELSNAKLTDAAFLRVLGRRPRPEESAAADSFLRTETDRAEATRSLLWSLLATNEFLFNH